MTIRDSYDAAAQAYADHLATELVGKPLDRHLLNRFAETVHGRVADVGCGPGHIARYLHDQGASVFGTDLSPAMIDVARRLHPALAFHVDDMRASSTPAASLGGIVAFYSIVHFEPAELGAIFAEMRRVLEPGGLVLVAFHVGDRAVHVDELFGVRVDLDFRFHVPAEVVAALAGTGLSVLEHAEREPYPDVEHPSRRCYLLARAS